MTAVSDFDFELPDALIAQEAAPRGDSRLLVLDRRTGTIEHATVRDLPRYLRAGDLVVANDTRVFPARLLGRRVPSGGAVECLLLARDHSAPSTEHSAPSTEHAALSTEHSALSTEQFWSALVHPGQKLKPGALVRFEHESGVLMAEILERQFFGRRRIRLWSEGGGARRPGSGQDVDALVDAMGHVPLPPYIQRPDTPADRERYQTVFAAHRGSIAAPTAGLHFDAPLLDAIDRAGVERVTITLHVGYGTFKPVRVEHIEEHTVDPEPYDISDAAARAINAALDQGRRLIAVGTTTTRALEHAGARRTGSRCGINPGRSEADLFIHPGFEFQIVSGLMTNFHLPKSSLLMLVAAFAGRERVLDAYREAVAQRYRFYSYGDAMVIL